MENIFKKYASQIKIAEQFLKQLLLKKEWFKGLGIELYDVELMHIRYKAYLSKFGQGDTEFDKFHRKEWLSLARRGDIAIVLDDPDLPIIGYEGGRERRLYWWCSSYEQMNILLDTGIPPKALHEAMYFYGLQIRTKEPDYDNTSSYIFKVVKGTPFENRSFGGKIHIEFPFYKYTFDPETTLSIIHTNMNLVSIIPFLNYGLKWKPALMRFSDNTLYKSRKTVFSVRELMKLFIKKLPLQCIEFLAFSERYPDCIMRWSNSLFADNIPNDLLLESNDPEVEEPIELTYHNFDGIKDPPKRKRKPIPMSHLLELNDYWSFTIMYKGDYIPKEFLLHFGGYPMARSHIKEKVKDKFKYLEKSKIYHNPFTEQMEQAWENISIPNWQIYLKSGKEDEIY